MAAAIADDEPQHDALKTALAGLSRESADAVARIQLDDMKRNLMDFVCFSCGKVVDSKAENEFRHWSANGSSSCDHNLVLNVTAFCLRTVSPSMGISNRVAVLYPEARTCLEALHQSRYGNLDWLYPERRAAASQLAKARFARAKDAIASVETKWRQFNDRFDEAIVNITRGIADALGESGAASWKEPGVEDKTIPFSGSAPSLSALAAGLGGGRFSNVVVLAGAGISTSAGVPDFRSAGGLYETLRAKGMERPEDLFSLEVYRKNPGMFAEHASVIIPHHLRSPAAGDGGGARPTPAHRFIRLLHEHGVLLRCYTQNIDDLESAAGLPPSKLVQAHGSFASARCIEDGCGAVAESNACLSSLLEANVPTCDACGGLVKPDIVFFGESLSPSYWEARKADMPKADLVIIMGTSLKVQPFAGQASEASPTTPRLLLNRSVVGADTAVEASTAAAATATATGGPGLRCDGREEHAAAGTAMSRAAPGNYRDVAVLGEVDAACAKLLECAGWATT